MKISIYVAFTGPLVGVLPQSYLRAGGSSTQTCDWLIFWELAQPEEKKSELALLTLNQLLFSSADA